MEKITGISTGPRVVVKMASSKTRGHARRPPFSDGHLARKKAHPSLCHKSYEYAKSSPPSTPVRSPAGHGRPAAQRAKAWHGACPWDTDPIHVLSSCRYVLFFFLGWKLAHTQTHTQTKTQNENEKEKITTQCTRHAFPPRKWHVSYTRR